MDVMRPKSDTLPPVAKAPAVPCPTDAQGHGLNRGEIDEVDNATETCGRPARALVGAELSFIAAANFIFSGAERCTGNFARGDLPLPGQRLQCVFS